MADPLAEVLRLVAEGRLTPDEAGPIIEALSTDRGSAERGRGPADNTGEDSRAAREARPAAAPGPPRRLKVRVRDRGRTVMDLQLPGIFAELAGAVPGIPAAYAERVREAIRSGLRGPIVDVVDEDGSGLTIVVD